MGSLEDSASEGTHTGVWGAGRVGHDSVGVDGEGAGGESPITHTADPEAAGNRMMSCVAISLLLHLHMFSPFTTPYLYTPFLGDIKHGVKFYSVINQIQLCLFFPLCSVMMKNVEY